MKRSCRVLMLAAAGVLAPSLASAATQGMLGTSSTGSIDISLTSVETPATNIQISGLQDAAFGSVQVGTTPTANTQSLICIYMSAAGTFTLLIQANTLINGSAMTTLDYGFNFTDRVGNQLGSSSGGMGTAVGGYTPSANPMCGTGQYASLTISPQTVPARAPGVMDNGLFTGTLSLTVAPE